MGLRGRPPKATAKHKSHGTYRKDRHARRADVKAPDLSAQKGPTLAPPFPIDEDARWLWDLVAAHMPTGLDPLDAATLAGLCRWWSIWRRADVQLMALEPEEVGPAFKFTCMAAAAWKQFEKLAARFGMTPADRARLKAPAEKKERNPFLDLLMKPSRQ